MGKVEIRAELIPGHHDALIEALGQHGPRAGNQMVFSISAACQKQWPVTLTDFTPPAHFTERAVVVKMTLREDQYPELYSLYKGLGHGNRQTVFLNMLNRHVSLSVGAPEAVMQAMTDYALSKAFQSAGKSPSSHEGNGLDVAAAAAEARESGFAPDRSSKELVQSPLPPDETPAPVYIPDPMATVDAGL